MSPARSSPGALFLALLVGTGVAACKDPVRTSADIGPEVSIIILPDPGYRDPGLPDPATETEAPADPGTEGGDPGMKDDADDPGIPDPGTDDPGTEDPGEDPGIFDPGFDPGTLDPGTSDPGCKPDCSARECGDDRCGGSCGTCVAPESCFAFQCVCQPLCGQRVCGDNQCGGSCGTCPGDAPCTSEGRCESKGPCTTTKTLLCEDLSVSASNNNGSDVLDVYPAACGGARTPGPEKVFRFVADGTGPVVFTLSSQPGWANLYLIKGETSCTPNWSTDACTAWSHDTITLEAENGTTYWIVVDATENNSNAWMTLAIDCEWYVPPPDR